MRIRLALPLVLVLALCATIQCHASSHLAMVGAKIYLSPTESPIERGSILIHNGEVLAVGPSAQIKIPRSTTVIDCKGLVVAAGFWNSHVHIFTTGLVHAETSLTTNPAQRFGYSTHRGRIAKGFDADLVVLGADPAQNTSAFSKVRYPIRHEEILYTAK